MQKSNLNKIKIGGFFVLSNNDEPNTLHNPVYVKRGFSRIHCAYACYMLNKPSSNIFLSGKTEVYVRFSI